MMYFHQLAKLVSEKAGNRIYRRPENPDERHESRVYFEDFVENTHANGVEIVFIIDECHLNVTEAANRDVISKLDPKSAFMSLLLRLLK